MFKFFLVMFFFLNSSYAEVIYLKPKAYLDVVSGQMISGKVLGIENGKIVSIDTQSPKKVIESDLYLLPGLIDCHAHLFFTQTIADKNFEDALLREAKLSDELRIKRAKKYLKDYLHEGFTTICDLGNSGEFLDVKLKKEISLDPQFPSLYVSGPGLATHKGQFYPNTDESLTKHEYQIINEKSKIEEILKSYLNQNVDILKIYMDNSPGIGGMDKAVVQKILNSPLSKKFKKVTFHAIEGNSVQYLSSLDSINIEHANYPAMFKSKNSNVTLTDIPKETLQEFNYYNKVYYLAQTSRAKSFFQSGVNLIFGPDFYFDKNDQDFNRAEYVKDSIRAWIEAEIPPLTILQAMTINSARALREENSIGRIQIGNSANIIGVKENPLLQISALKKVNFLMNKGQIILNRP